MTMRELLVFFEGLYGEKYAGVFLEVMTSYLDGYSADFYQAAAVVLVKRYSRSYGKAPGPAEIEKNKEEILAVMPKPAALPEPAEEKATPEQAEAFLKKMREMLSGGTGPMARTLEKTLGSMAGQKPENGQG
jgi:hypothetical protein